MKKVFKILFVILSLFVALLIAIPFVLESKIESIARRYAEENINAEVRFNTISLSLISSFPNAEIHIEDLNLINRAPFDGQTLATAKDIALEMAISELFKGSSDPIEIKSIAADALLLTIASNKNGTVNYDIMKTTASETDQGNSTSEAFSFDIQDYALVNSGLTYIDEESGIKVYLTEFNHNGKGLFSGSVSQLDTHTDGFLSISADSSSYLTNTSVKLDALLELNLDTNTYTFRKNNGYINGLPIAFEGFVRLMDTGQHISISFKNPESSFKDFLGLIPNTYSESFDAISTTGNFSMEGILEGLLSEQTIPHLDISLTSNNASFKYPNLPKRVEDIAIDVQVKNTTGLTKDTYIDVNTLAFRIDEDQFTSEAHISDLTNTINVAAKVNGVINLNNLSKAYPINLETQLDGLVNANLRTNFDMDAIEKRAYNRIKSTGNLNVTGLVFSTEAFPNPLQINTADLKFTPGLVRLERFSAFTGNSDLSATGGLSNVLGFLLTNQKLKGDLEIQSNQILVSDFMTPSKSEDSSDNTSSQDNMKLPDFLDCKITATAKRLVYDNLNLTDVKGQLQITDQTAMVSNVSSNIFGGQLSASGTVSTQTQTPQFDMKLGMDGFNISQSFNDMDMLSSLAPIAEVVQGKLNADIAVRGALGQNFTPDLNSISGQAFAEVATAALNTDKSAILNGFVSKLNFMDSEDLKAMDFKTTLNFENGLVTIDPFSVQFKDIPIEISGSHSFNNSINYTTTMQVPAKYLGSDINRLIGQINDSEINNITIPVTAKIDGTFGEPRIKTDLTSGINDLTRQLVAIQKQKLLNQGADGVNTLLSDLLGKTKADSTKTKREGDTTTSKGDVLKNEAESILGTLLGGKKKSKGKKVKDSTKKG